MPFKIKNLQPTHIEVFLASRTVTIGALGEAGPFEDSDRSTALAILERRGDVAVYDVTPPEPAEAEPAPKPGKSTVTEDKS